MEILFIRLKAAKSTWLELHNVYLPNTCTQHTLFNPLLIKPGPSSLILGDLNGHSQIWDSSQPQDQRGDEILDWILDNDLHILNDGSATPTSRITGNGSISDISLCGSKWSAKTSWRLAEGIRSSDHLPIIIEVNHKICYKPVIPKPARICRNGVDWSCFTNEVESKMSNLSHEPNLSLQISHFNEILISAATTHVGKSKPSKNLNLGQLLICEPKSALEIVSTVLSIKTARSGQMLVVKLLRQSMRPSQKSGKIFSKIRCQILTVPTCGKPCPTTIALSLILNQKLMYSSTTMPGSANSPCHNPSLTSTDSSRNVSTHHLLTMKAVLHF